jgi:hypothetical protein
LNRKSVILVLRETKGDAIGKSYTKSIANTQRYGYRQMKKILAYIDGILLQFRSCFNREATFKWFLIAIAGFMIRTDHLGVASMVREMMVDPSKYTAFIHFFHSTAWNLDTIKIKWLEIIKGSGQICRIFDKPVLIGDGVKQPKEAIRTPGVKKLRQESEDSTKSEFIRGQMFGGLGVIIGNAAKMFCLPLSMSIHDGNKSILEWSESEYKGDSHVTRLAREACKAAGMIGQNCFLLLDRYFLTRPMLEAVAEETKKAGKDLVKLITRPKDNYTAWTVTENKGAKPKVKDALKIKDFFHTEAACFTEAELSIYGNLKEVRYLCRNLLWGRDLYQELRFVFTVVEHVESIFVCTDLAMDPCQIIEMYCYRFKIETLFRAFKQTLAGFSCRFWTSKMPVFQKYLKATEMELEVAATCSGMPRDRIVNTYNAIEGFVFFACIAMGLIQLISLRFSKVVNDSKIRWLRTAAINVPSEETTANFIRHAFRLMLDKCDDLALVRAVRERQYNPQSDSDHILLGA